jgi:hypothetical protein
LQKSALELLLLFCVTCGVAPETPIRFTYSSVAQFLSAPTVMRSDPEHPSAISGPAPRFAPPAGQGATGPDDRALWNQWIAGSGRGFETASNTLLPGPGFDQRPVHGEALVAHEIVLLRNPPRPL